MIDEDENNACDDFKIDVTASEFNTCKNCHLHRKFHGASNRPSNRPSNVNSAIKEIDENFLKVFSSQERARKNLDSSKKRRIRPKRTRKKGKREKRSREKRK